MFLEGMTVCVGYDDLLRISLSRWLDGLDRLVVVTSPQDSRTWSLCQEFSSSKLFVYATDLFYADGASFNKAKAMEHGRKLLHACDWVVLFDADIMPPRTWRVAINEAHLKTTHLYSPKRYICETQQEWGDLSNKLLPLPDFQDLPLPLVPDREQAGYFQLFHTSQPSLQNVEWFRRAWPHAGGYDSSFQKHWTTRERGDLPFRVIHLGSERVNWHGRITPRWDELSIVDTGGLSVEEATIKSISTAKRHQRKSPRMQ
jgi:hypothetical protein